jgi:hypothetical protein
MIIGVSRHPACLATNDDAELPAVTAHDPLAALRVIMQLSGNVRYPADPRDAARRAT